MSNQEFTENRDGLANAFAAAGAELLAYQPLVSTAVAPIPDTRPQKYAVAGTLKGILSMAGKMMGDEGGPVAGGPVAWMRNNLSECKTDAEVKHMESLEFGRWKEIAASFTIPLYAAPAHPVSAAEKPTGDLTDERNRVREEFELAVKLGARFDIDSAMLNVDALVRAAIAAHLARHPKAEQPQGALDALGTTIKAVVNMLPAKEAGALIAAFGEVAHLARQAQAEPIAYVNRDELDNMLDDRTATIQTSQSNWRRTPLYAAPVAPAGAQNDLTTVECPTCNGHGMVGRLMPPNEFGGGYDAQGCDDCDGQGKVIVSRKDLAGAQNAIPADVRRALDRMCTPLHESRLSGATADEDARCMQIIRNYIEAGAQNAEAIRNQAYGKCIEIAESELSNTNSLASMPPQSAAAFSIINRIRFLQTGSANTQEGGV